jgi:hypothetical protein
MSKQTALHKVQAFKTVQGNGVFPHIDRQHVADGLEARIKDPGLIDQGVASVCGPAALLYHIASDDPEYYANFVIQLYETGRASLGKLLIEPRDNLRQHAPDLSDVNEVDWISLASIRNTENWFHNYHAESQFLPALTFPETLAGWFRTVGYTDVKNRTNIFWTKGRPNAVSASDLFEHGYKVCLFIHADLLSTSPREGRSWAPNHWVVLTKKITYLAGQVDFGVFGVSTWGDARYSNLSVPEKQFFHHYYGFVACRN